MHIRRRGNLTANGLVAFETLVTIIIANRACAISRRFSSAVDYYLRLRDVVS